MNKVREHLEHLRKSAAPEPTRDEMAKRREVRGTIEATLKHSKAIIEDIWNETMDSNGDSFSVDIDGDITGGILEESRVASDIRKWVVDNYGLYPDAPIALEKFEIQLDPTGKLLKQRIVFTVARRPPVSPSTT